MKTPKTAFAVGFLDDDLIESAEKCGTQKKKSNLTRKKFKLNKRASKTNKKSKQKNGNAIKK